MNRFLQNQANQSAPTNPFIAGLQNQILQAALQRQKLEDDQKRLNHIHPAFRPAMPNLSIFPFGPVSHWYESSVLFNFIQNSQGIPGLQGLQPGANQFQAAPQATPPPNLDAARALLANQARLPRGNPSTAHGGIDVGLVSKIIIIILFRNKNLAP